MKLRHKAALTVSIILSAWNENCAVHTTGIFLCIYLFNCWKTCVFFIKTPTNTQTTATTTKQSHQFGYSYRIWSSCLPSNPIRDIRSYLRVWLEVFPLMSKKSPHMHSYNCLCLLHMVLYWFPDIEKSDENLLLLLLPLKSWSIYMGYLDLKCCYEKYVVITESLAFSMIWVEYL